MTVAKQLVCTAPGVPPQLAMRSQTLPAPKPGQVLVRNLATSVNPIDVKRTAGYGQRLLAFKGAARFPLVLGNDLAGIVEAAGAGQSTWRAGDLVYGLLPTGPQGAHASHVLADAALLRPQPAHHAPEALAALPYTFTTLWLALQGIGLTPEQARGKAVLVHGASGGLGQLALQVLGRWGARVTAVCSTPHVQTCLDLGAHEVFDRQLQRLSTLPRAFDASLNFAAWEDELTLVSRLRPGAIGHATTVHPLLASFDERGWLQGGIQVWQQWSGMRRHLKATAPSARYAWVVFSPSAQALDALHGMLTGPGLRLPLGKTVPLSQGHLAFAHVAQHRAGRAILIPE